MSLKNPFQELLGQHQIPELLKSKIQSDIEIIENNTEAAEQLFTKYPSNLRVVYLLPEVL